MKYDSSGNHEIHAARQEPQQFLGPLLQNQRSKLHRMARRRMTAKLRSAMDTSDVIQQTMVEAWRGWPGFLGQSKGQFINWLQTVLRRVVYRETKHLERQPDAMQFDSSAAVQIVSTHAGVRGFDPTASAQQAEDRRALMMALEQVSPLQKQIIVLRHFHALQFPEIAALTSRSTAASRMVYVRGIISLRTILDRESTLHNNNPVPGVAGERADDGR